MGRTKKDQKPEEIHLQLTYECNLNCEMCGQKKDNGYFGNSNEIYQRFENRECDLSDWLKLIEEVKKFNPKIFLWGGEPLLNPNFTEIVKKIKEEDIEILLITNGVLLENFIDFIIEQQIDTVCVSINGTKEIHNEIVGVDVFDKIKKNIESLKKMKEQKGYKNPKIETNFVILPKNYKNIPQFLDFAEEIGIESVRLSVPWFTNSKLGKKYEETLEREFNCNANSWKSWVVDEWDIDFEELKGILRRELDKSHSFDLNLIPIDNAENIDDWYKRIDKTFGVNICRMPNNMVSAFANGEVGFCSDFPDYTIGNIKEQSFEEIWNSKRAEEFRKYLNEELLPICNRCCSLLSDYNTNQN